MLTFCARVSGSGFEPSKNWAEVCHRWGDERLAIMGEQPHWYLWAVAVQPACADAGVHSTLMHCVIDQAVRSPSLTSVCSMAFNKLSHELPAVRIMM